MSLDYCIEKCFHHKFVDNGESSVRDLPAVLSKCGDENYIHRYPYSILWKITTACNLRCKHCLYRFKSGSFDAEDNYNTEELMRLATFFVEELNLISFSITGGEPFLQKGIFELLEYLRSKNVYIDIKTNATLITEEVAERLFNILDREQTVIQVSLEGASSQINDRIRGRGAFEKTVRGIKSLSERGFRVRISCTVTSENVNDICSLYSLCKDLGVSELLLGKFKVCDEKQRYLEPILEDVFCSIAKLIDFKGNDETIGINLGVLMVCDFLNFTKGIQLMDEYVKTKEDNIATNLVCHKHNRFVLNADGQIYLCTDTESDEFCLGNLHEKSFDEIWNNRFENIFFKKRDKCICTKCKYIEVCHGGCPARAYKVYGDINAPDGACLYAKKMNYI